MKRGGGTGYFQNKAFINGNDAELTAKEFALLLLLVKNENRVFSPASFTRRCGVCPLADDTRTIRFHIKNLKRKINSVNSRDYNIISVYGKGYMFTTTEL